MVIYNLKVTHDVPLPFCPVLCESLLTWNDKYQAKKIKFECLLRHSDKFIAGIFLRIDFQTKSSAGDNIHGECPGISGELEYTLVRGKKLLYDQDIIQLHVMKDCLWQNQPFRYYRHLGPILDWILNLFVLYFRRNFEMNTYFFTSKVFPVFASLLTESTNSLAHSFICLDI